MLLIEIYFKATITLKFLRQSQFTTPVYNTKTANYNISCFCNEQTSIKNKFW